MKRLVLCVMLLGAVVAAAQNLRLEDPRPQIVNGKLSEQAMSGTLAQTIERLGAGGQAAWIGYSVPKVAGVQQMCCFNARSAFRGNPQCCGGCRLESGDNSNTMGRVNDCPEPQTDRFFVLVRVGSGEVLRIRPASVDCGLDLGGLTLYWLNQVKPAESVAWLSSFLTNESKKQRNNALTALALHQDPAAEAVLFRLLKPPQPKDIRNQAAFWLGSEHGRKGYEAVRDAIRNDSDSKFRQEAIFALSESEEPDAQQEMIRLAHEDRDPDVRGQALFWLAQKAGRKVGGVITDVIENDPDTDIKKKAVFALTQMDHNEGVPLLIQVAKTNKNPVVRKEAIFWLGQSEDPRALDYIESILTK